MKIFERKSYRGSEIIVHEEEQPDIRARLALSMIDRWGMAAAKPEGEDSAGRSKLGLLTSDELVSRACEVADTGLTEFRKRGWMVPVPEPKYVDDK